MTRKESIKRMKIIMDKEKLSENNIATNLLAELIDEIFDDFEKQCNSCKFNGNDNGESWEEGYKQCLRERICKNCKWHKYNKKTKYFECQNPDVLDFVVINIRNDFDFDFDKKLGFEPNPYNEDCDNFGCNKFERVKNERNCC